MGCSQSSIVFEDNRGKKERWIDRKREEERWYIPIFRNLSHSASVWNYVSFLFMILRFILSFMKKPENFFKKFKKLLPYGFDRACINSSWENRGWNGPNDCLRTYYLIINDRKPILKKSGFAIYVLDCDFAGPQCNGRSIIEPFPKERMYSGKSTKVQTLHSA